MAFFVPYPEAGKHAKYCRGAQINMLELIEWKKYKQVTDRVGSKHVLNVYTCEDGSVSTRPLFKIKNTREGYFKGRLYTSDQQPRLEIGDVRIRDCICNPKRLRDGRTSDEMTAYYASYEMSQREFAQYCSDVGNNVCFVNVVMNFGL